jgi:acetate kinase
MADAILVLNAGSSSLKYSVFRVGAGEPLFRGNVGSLGTAGGTTHEQAVAAVLERCAAQIGGDRIVAVGHRVVHGGTKYTTPVAVTPEVLADLNRLVPLAPLHQPHNLAAVRAAIDALPAVSQVACFDTAFHRTQPEVAQWFGLPRKLTDEGVRRYGFHGLSYEYIATVLPGVDAAAAAGRTIVAHLGNGASLCAMRGGKSVATTMSFTPADGLMMGTRSGSLDPGVLLYLMQRHGMDAAALENLIYHESGLLGVSGVSSDMRELLTSADPHAAEAVDLFVYRIGREVGSLAAALGGVDALVFTGGIGENAAAIRDRVTRDAAWLGPVRVHVIPTNEELMIANHARSVLGL